jgi:hypothetical protein
VAWGDILSPEKLISVNIHFVFFHGEHCGLPVAAAGERTLPISEIGVRPGAPRLNFQPLTAPGTIGQEFVPLNLDGNHGFSLGPPSAMEQAGVCCSGYRMVGGGRKVRRFPGSSMEIQFIFFNDENRPLFQAATGKGGFPMGEVGLGLAVLGPDLLPLPALPALSEIPVVFHLAE